MIKTSFNSIFAILLPSFIYLVLFVLYSTWIHNNKIEEDRKGGAYHVTNL